MSDKYIGNEINEHITRTEIDKIWKQMKTIQNSIIFVILYFETWYVALLSLSNILTENAIRKIINI
jgi:hypothetical protein